VVVVDEADGGRRRPSRGGGRARRRFGFSGDEKNSGEWLWQRGDDRGHFQRATGTAWQAELGRSRSIGCESGLMELELHVAQILKNSKKALKSFRKIGKNNKSAKI
jgi:hypothetical protein